MRRRDENFPDNGFEAWGGYMRAKIAKLEDQYSTNVEKEENITNIFSGVSIYVNGFTVPSADELKTIMSKNGGVYHTYQRSEDFIIASNLPDSKVKNMSLAKVVKPQWITDSLAVNKLLDYREYLLYKCSRTQRKLTFEKIAKNDSNTDIVVKKEGFQKVSNVPESNEMFFYIHKSEATVAETDHGNNNLEIIANSKNNTNQIQQVTKTAADPNFISEFYNNSRLHHISQLGACFKQHVNDLRETSNFNFPARAELKERILHTNNDFFEINFDSGKTIMHIDMDCFFVSVGLRNRPDLRGKPVAVTHSKGGQARLKRPGVDRSTEFNLYKQKQANKLGKIIGIPEAEIESRVDNITDENDKYGSMSEIASCSYEARAKGVGNGMFMGAALRLCPDLQTIPYDFEGYKEVAYTLYNTIAQYTLDIEAVSCDEMYVDCTELLKDMSVSVQNLATLLREEIKTKTDCPCSTGFGGNRLQARLATKRAKPDGQFFLTADLVADFMFNIQLKDLPGVGRQTAQKLESLGHRTCGSLQNLTLASLKCHLGTKTGAQLFDQCRGRDLNALSFNTVRKSVSAEVNYGIRFENNDQCIEFLKQLSAEVHSRMLQLKVLGKCVTLKLMVRAEEAPVETAKFMGHGFCNVISKSTSLNNTTNDVETITKGVIALWKKLNIDPKEMRGIGIQITKLEQIKSKETKGAINKFLCHKPIKSKSDYQSNNETDLHTDEVILTETKFENFDNIPQTPDKPKAAMSPRNKSPIIGGSMKSPTGKRRGRPTKNVSLQQTGSKNLMSRFLQGVTKEATYKDPLITEKIITTETKIKEEAQGLSGLSWKKVRELLRAWLDSGQTPLACDVNLIAAYMRGMVMNRNIEKVNVLINYLRRRTREVGSTEWLEVYNHVVEHVQNAMLTVYGKKLFIGN